MLAEQRALLRELGELEHAISSVQAPVLVLADPKDTLVRAIHGVSRHATSAHSCPAPRAASSLSQPFTHPGPTLASRTTACTRCGARLAADNATPPP